MASLFTQGEIARLWSVCHSVQDAPLPGADALIAVGALAVVPGFRDVELSEFLGAIVRPDGDHDRSAATFVQRVASITPADFYPHHPEPGASGHDAHCAVCAELARRTTAAATSAAPALPVACAGGEGGYL